MKDEKREVRIDKWLWAVRLFKTRTLAVEICKKGRVSIKGVTVKPARMVKVGDVIEIRKNPIIYSFEVLDISANRMGAKLVPNFMKDVTSPSQLEILEQHRSSGFIDRDRGAGRPTKKDRRELEDFADSSFFDDFDFEEEE